MLRTVKDLQGCAIRRCEARPTVPEITRVEHDNGCHRRATVGQRRAGRSR
jgi:hypothetical protein